MPNLSKQQLEALWVGEGGKPDARETAAAVALAESSGNPQATNHNTDGSTDRGLWQINSVHGALSTYSIPGNTLAAISISNDGTDWEPWTTYKTGAYRQYAQGAAIPLGSGGGRSFISEKLEEIIPGEGKIPLLGELFKKSQEAGQAGGEGIEEAVPGLKGAEELRKKVGGLGEILSFLFSTAGWVRIGKVVVGLFLLLTGVLGMANISTPSAVPIPV